MAYIKYKIYKNTSSAGVMNKFYACAYHDEPPMAAREALTRAAAPGTRATATYRWGDRAMRRPPSAPLFRGSLTAHRPSNHLITNH